jgi:hypothetical protein
MAAINLDYLKSLQKDPEQSVAVIIKTNDSPAAYTARAEELGLTVTRTFSLISAIAATGPARAVIALTSEPWVDSIEPDQPVHTA